MGRAWESPVPPGYEPPPHYAADVGNARDRFGEPMTVGDPVAVIAGIYINRTGVVLDVNMWVGAAAVYFPNFGTRVVPFDCLQRKKCP